MRADAACVRVWMHIKRTVTQDSVNKTISWSQIKVYYPVLVFMLDQTEID